MSAPFPSEYEAALHFLYGRINYEHSAAVPYRSKELNLAQMRRLLGHLDDPHLKLPIVHIAGTKGKGSTAAMISAILVAAGYQVGLYTSPHLSKLEERFAVNGSPCSASDLVELVNILKEVVLKMDADPTAGRPTFFEITTAMAILHFLRQKCDIVVLEVGMGGRLDSTNVCMPLVSVITNISFDHTKQLGNTLAAIAGEKAGIIKPGVPVVSGVVAPEPAGVIEAVARQRQCPLFREGDEFLSEFESNSEGPGNVRFTELTSNREAGHSAKMPLGMLGRHQAANAGVALATVALLRKIGWDISDAACRQGLETARCPARIEVVSRQPTVILDSAHNLASIQALTATLDESFPGDNRHLIFAVARDKDVTGILRLLLPKFKRAVLTNFLSNPRSVPAESLAELAMSVGQELNLGSLSIQSTSSPEAAWQLCRAAADPESVICITGSFFLAAELRSLVSPIK